MNCSDLPPSANLCIAAAPGPGPSAEPAAPNPSRWEDAVAAFEQSDRVSPPPKGAILFTGASIITRWATLAADFPQYPVINRGFGGSEIADITHFAPRMILPYAPRTIYLRSGGNDLKRGKSVDQVFADFRELADTVHAALPHTDLVFISLSPSIARRNQGDQEQTLNTRINDYIQGKDHLRHLDIHDLVLGPDGEPLAELFVKDGLHFNAEGYKLLAARIAIDLNR
jgi:lysophospholipase L1-like esterase